MISTKTKDYTVLVREQILVVQNGRSEIFPSLRAAKTYIEDFFDAFPDTEDNFEIYVVKCFKQEENESVCKE